MHHICIICSVCPYKHGDHMGGHACGHGKTTRAHNCADITDLVCISCAIGVHIASRQARKQTFCTSDPNISVTVPTCGQAPNKLPDSQIPPHSSTMLFHYFEPINIFVNFIYFLMILEPPRSTPNLRDLQNLQNHPDRSTNLFVQSRRFHSL